MSAPRRPGGGDRRPGRPARPGARRPQEPDKPEGTHTERPAKPVRMRRDGSAASGNREAREVRAEAKSGRAASARAPGNDRPRNTQASGKPTRARRDGSTASGNGEARGEGKPARATPAGGRSSGRRHNTDASNPRPATRAATHRDGSVASSGRGAREAGADSTPARATSARTPGKTAQGRGRQRDGEASRERPAPRARRDGSVAGGSRDVREARAEERPARVAARPPRARGQNEGRPAAAAVGRAKPGPRTRADGSVATHNAERTERTSKEPQRIAKLLARAGIASRREIERMIAEGRIAIDGTVLDTPATTLTSLRGVTVDGKQVAAPEATRLFLFHKPAGFLTTERDPRGRPTIYDRLPQDLPRIVPVGRLDLATEGLLLLTTDGGFKRQLELPATGVPRVYRARAYGEVSQDQLEALIEGVEIDGVRYGQIDANLERRTGRNVWIEMVLTEGKNREVRRVLEYLGLQVSRLIRTAYGPFVLGELPPGEVGEVKQHDLVEFRKTLK